MSNNSQKKTFLKEALVPGESSFEASEEDASRDILYRPAALAFVIGSLVGILVTAKLLPALREQPLWIRLAVSLLPFQFFAFGATCLGLMPVIRKFGFRKTFDIPDKVRLPHLKQTGRLLIIAFVMVAVSNGIAALLWKLLGLRWMPQSIVQLISQSRGAAVWMVALLGTVILAPLSEEVMMRLVIFRTLRSYFPGRAECDAVDEEKSRFFGIAPVLTSLVFACCHGSLQYIPALFCIGCCLQIARRHGGLAASIFLHSIYNLASVIGLFLTVHY